MLSGQIYDMINKINLSGFKTALEEQLESSIYNEMSFIDRISILLEREVIFRENKAIQRKLMDAKLKLKASLEDIKIDSQRGIDSNLLKNLTVYFLESEPNASKYAPFKKWNTNLLVSFL